MDKESRARKAGKYVRTEGIALAIPMVLVAYPLGAAFLGKLLADWLGHQWIIVVAIILGLTAGIRECVRLVRLLNRSQS